MEANVATKLVGTMFAGKFLLNEMVAPSVNGCHRVVVVVSTQVVGLCGCHRIRELVRVDLGSRTSLDDLCFVGVVVRVVIGIVQDVDLVVVLVLVLVVIVEVDLVLILGGVGGVVVVRAGVVSVVVDRVVVARVIVVRVTVVRAIVRRLYTSDVCHALLCTYTTYCRITY